MNNFWNMKQKTAFMTTWITKLHLDNKGEKVTNIAMMMMMMVSSV
jgi:hypothetical protein